MVECHHCKAREAPGVSTMSLCSGCLRASYCDAKCQKADRAVHREWCNDQKSQREAQRAAPPALSYDSSGLNAGALRRAADAGDPEAMSKLAGCYTAGVGGVAVDYVGAFRWYKRAAEVPGTSPVAYHNLAVCYDTGRGTPKNPVEAVRLYKMAAEIGLPNSQFNLGLCLQRGEGVPRDPVEAFMWLQRAADAENSDAQCQVGLALETGLGVEQDKALGVVYYRRSADQGNETAMNNLGNCYRDGIGVPRDASLAVLWMKRALDAGEPNATLSFSWLATSLSPSEVFAMDAGTLHALLEGLGVRVPLGLAKPRLVELVLQKAFEFGELY